MTKEGYMVWTVDVWHVPLDRDGNAVWAGQDWRRFLIEAPDATEAELAACQWSGTVHGMAVKSVVLV